LGPFAGVKVQKRLWTGGVKKVPGEPSCERVHLFDGAARHRIAPLELRARLFGGKARARECLSDAFCEQCRRVTHRAQVSVDELVLVEH
jgi:hypothetical protein